MRLISLDEINSTLGCTLSVEFITTTINVAQCDERGRYSSNSGMWDAKDFAAIRDRLVNWLMYRVPDDVPMPPQAFISNFF